MPTNIVRRSIPARRTPGVVARPCPSARPITGAARLSTILALALAVPVLGVVRVAPAPAALAAGQLSPYHLTLNDFDDAQGAEDVSCADKGTVSGVCDAPAISLGIHAASLTLFTHRHAGYAELAFDVGIADSSDADRRSKLVITADGKPADATPSSVIVQSYGQAATHVVVHFDKASSITLAADPDGTQGIEDLIVAKPTLFPAGPARAAARVGASRTLLFGDFVDRQGAQDVSGTADSAVSGHTHPYATLLGIHAASISLFTHTNGGYTKLAFDVGVSDTSTTGRTSVLVMSADGKPADATPAHVVVQKYGQPLTHVVVSFGHATLITLAADPNGTQGIEDLVIVKPTLQR